MTEPRNFAVAAPKQGKTKTSFFQTFEFKGLKLNCSIIKPLILLGDKYLDPDSRNRQYELEKKRKMPADQPVFKPASFYKTM